MGNLDVKYLFESQCELIDNIKELLKVLYGKKYGKELERLYEEFIDEIREHVYSKKESKKILVTLYFSLKIIKENLDKNMNIKEENFIIINNENKLLIEEFMDGIVINAKNEFALSSSIEQLNGRVSEKIKSLREKIIYNIAFIESALDDPEHISIDGYSEKLSKILEEVNGELSRLINNFDNGRIVKEGVKTVILGKPNAGKSSLLNLLLGEERAIVTDIEGTTRDTLEESINLNGVFLNLIDTAGIRDSEDVVEQIGVNKAKELAEKSDLVIFVADASKELDENDKEIINLIKDKQAIVLLNKSDLGTIINEKNVFEFDNKPVITFSAKTGDGLDELENKIRDLFYEGKVKYNDELYITNARQKESLINAKNSIEEVIKSVENDMPEDFYSIDLMDAYTYLGQIIGESVEDDLVNEIFSKFCMGK